MSTQFMVILKSETSETVKPARYSVYLILTQTVPFKFSVTLTTVYYPVKASFCILRFLSILNFPIIFFKVILFKMISVTHK